ncbi:hypothetical protein NM208_g1030 [Fusarium decemcellulare]|uniref:Uncharacterized protein n=1 Tax=Fusarium decemcellulare TaxID=57161 RepID=A0ACC1SXL6_9HYPO|nr:hypothetical protein NM208_g1030 [Fusarium decemcellulare]
MHTKTNGESQSSTILKWNAGHGKRRISDLGTTDAADEIQWPQLELLADFMEVGTIPTRWCIFPGEQKQNGQRQRYTYPIDIEPRRSEQRYRASRVNAALLRYQAKEKCVITRFKSQKPGDEASAALGRAADHIAKTASRDEFNLFVVEDLSRDVIESLGGAFGIDPRFFRAHITEYVWNNIRDRWREPSVLEVDAQRRDWFQMRLVRSRYFSTQKELGDAKKEADGFNIVRRVIADDNDIFWDKDLECARSWWHKSEGRLETEPVDAKIGHIRSRATFWLSPDLPVGVLLLEPTPKTGFPLWRGYGNWDNIPQFEHRLYERPEYPYDNHEIPPSLQRKETDNHMSWFEEYLYWAQRPIHPVKLPESQGNTVHSVPIQSLLHLVCGEWLTFADYLNTRLNQIDWGIANPSFFPDTDTDSRKQSLDKLHFWRRSVPQARDMLQNCIRQTFQFTGSLDVPRITKPYEDDYKAVMERLIDYELRIDRLSSAVNSAISLEDARSTSNLTILASIFIPPSLVAALLSMSTDPLAELFPALKWWAIVSTTVVVIIFGVLLALNSADKWLEKVKLLILIPMSYIQAEAKNKDWETNSIV